MRMSYLFPYLTHKAYIDTPPNTNISIGILALIACFVIYVVSSSSMGKRSLCHTWLFSGLLFISPTEDCLEDEDTSHIDIGRSRRKNSRKLSSIKDLSDISFTCKSITPGSVPLFLMTEKNQVALRQWQALDALVCFGVACLVVLTVPCLIAFHRAYQLDAACCDDLKCWLQIWREQKGGAGWIMSAAPPANFVLLILATTSAWIWWRLVLHSTRLPQGSIFHFSPFSYINAWFIAFVTMFLLHLTANTTISDQNQKPTKLFGIPLNAALEEWSARVTMWVGLTGFYSPGDESARGRTLSTVLQLTHLLLAASMSLLAFAVADPLRETMRLYWNNAFGDEVEMVGESASRLLRLLRRSQVRNTMVSLACLPVLCWVSYLVPENFFQQTSPCSVRTVLAWFFIWTMGCVMKPLLQEYLLHALSAAKQILDTAKKPVAQEVLFPFQKRYRNLVATGSQLAVFPFIILIILTLGHGAGSPAAVVSNNESLSTGIYPFVYHQSIWNDVDLSDYQEWEEFQARALAQQTLEDTSVWAKISPARANVDLCPVDISLSFISYENRKKAGARRKDSNVYLKAIYRISNASQLLANARVITTHFVHVLRNLQQLAKKTRDSTAIATVKKGPEEREWKKAWRDFYICFRALLFHPLLTSTIVLPFLDFIGFVLCTLWILYFTYYGVSSWLASGRRRKYVLHVREDSCRVISTRPYSTARTQQ